ncbi:hypothetical protein ABZX85_35015 [Streptomyces sp. NPDC004539]|uniref:hypothetical protein n=1 Tax=Streptomyces sp. NPDC004539 TaxID=3154280 RepID=UPI0033BA0A2A
MLLPASHVRAEFVEAVRITGPAGHLTSRGLSGEVVEVWVAEEAREVLRLAGELPDGEQHRCFVPGWGLRAHDEAGPLFEIAFCFRCHGVRVWGPGLPPEVRGQNFDAGSAAALELLARFRACTPGTPGTPSSPAAPNSRSHPQRP